MSGISLLISHFGDAAIFLLMALESCCIPIPSEVVMPFAGYLAYIHTLNFWPVIIIGTVANLAGSLVAYAIGMFGGRPLIRKFGRVILLSEHHLDKAEKWFSKYGEITVFFGRMIPAVRTFISLPAGIARMSLVRFIVFSLLGSLPWNFAMVYAGYQLHARWQVISDKVKPFTYVGIIIIIVALLWFWFSMRNRQNRENTMD